MSLFIINTNLQKDTRYEREMLQEEKCAACRSTKTDIQNIQKNDKVLLYTNKKRNYCTRNCFRTIVYERR